MVNRMYNDVGVVEPRLLPPVQPKQDQTPVNFTIDEPAVHYEIHEEVQESLSLEDREKELIRKALDKHRGRRKHAAEELGISERTLYRKIKEYDIQG